MNTPRLGKKKVNVRKNFLGLRAYWSREKKGFQLNKHVSNNGALKRWAIGFEGKMGAALVPF